MLSRVSRCASVGLVFLLVVLNLISVTGCNAGLAGIFAGLSGDDSSDGNAPASVGSFSIVSGETSPATVRFVVTDAESETLEFELFYSTPTQDTRSVSALVGRPNPDRYEGSPGGTIHEVQWDFTSEPGFDPAGGFVAGVTIFAQQVGAPGVATLVPGANGLDEVGLGNDPPTVTFGAAPAETTAIALVELVVSDSSADVVDLVIEYDIVDDIPDAGWQLTRPGGLATTPPISVENTIAEPTGTAVQFAWDTFIDLPAQELDVRIRVTPSDPSLTGTPAISDVRRIDNNTAPVAVFQDVLLANSTDRTGGIPLPIVVIDAESDVVELVVQWNRAGTPFPALPSTRDDLLAAVADPALRRQLQLCAPRVRPIEGPLHPIDATRAHLPWFWKEFSVLFSVGLTGRTIEILRPHGQAVPISTSMLVDPVAVIPGDDPLDCFVLDQPVLGTWRIQSLALDGDVAVTIATGTGTPITIDRDSGSLLVATSEGTTWTLRGIDADGAPIGEVSGPGTLRDFVAEGPRAGYATIDDAVLRVAFPPGGAQILPITQGLDTPWGIALDPITRQTLYVAEHGADRVITLRTDDQTISPVPAIEADGSGGFVAPRAVEVAADRRTLWVDTGAGLRLRTLRRSGTRTDGTPGPVVAAGPATMAPLRFALGPGGLFLAIEDGFLIASGGVEQRRTIVAADRTQQSITVEAPFDPPLVEARRYRTEHAPIVRTTPTGVRGIFPWDVTDLPLGGLRDDEFIFQPPFYSPDDIVFRAYPLDSDIGVYSESQEPIQVGPGYATELVPVPDGRAIPSDIDRDGDLDLFLGNGPTSQVLYQGRPGEFTETSDPIAFDPGPQTPGPLSSFEFLIPGITPCAATDLDQDGRVDLIAAGEVGTLVAFQASDGTFDFPVSFPYSRTGTGVIEVRAVDLTGDGELELVTTHRASGEIVVQARSGPREWSLLANLFVSAPLPVAQRSWILDHDEDGDLDLLVGVETATSVSGHLVAFPQTAPGTFGPQELLLDLPTSLPEGGPLGDFAILDGDRDGDRDWWTSLGGGGFLDPPLPLGDSLVLHERLEDGSIEIGSVVVTEIASTLAFADVRGDGWLDVFSTSAGLFGGAFTEIDPGLIVPPEATFLTDESEIFGPPPFRSIPTDLDGDGDVDFLSRSTWNRALDGTGEACLDPLGDPLEAIPGLFEGRPTRPSGIVASDIDEDGDLDLLLPTGSSMRQLVIVFPGGPMTIYPDGAVHVVEQIAPRQFRLTQRLVAYAEGAAMDVEIADFDGDGAPDLVVSSWDSYPCGIGAGCVGFSDAGSSPEFGEGRVTIFRRIAPGIYDETPWVEIHGDPPEGLDVADLDGDGDNDIVASYRGRVVVLLQTAPGVFDPTSVAPFPTTGPTAGVAIGDLDGDGLLDIVSGPLLANPTNDPATNPPLTISWQSAPGVWDPMTVPGVFGEPARSFVVRDVDQDGLPDIIYSEGRNGTAVVVCRQIAPGTFDSTRLETGGSAVQSSFEGIEIIDVDRDGDLDIVSANQGGEFQVFEQVGVGRFEHGTKFRGAPDPPPGQPENLGVVGNSGGVVVDIDGDGSLDYVGIARLVSPDFTPPDGGVNIIGHNTVQVGIHWGGE